MCIFAKLKKKTTNKQNKNKNKTNKYKKKRALRHLLRVFRERLFFIICAISLFVKAANQEAILQFGAVRSEELEVNQ